MTDTTSPSNRVRTVLAQGPLRPDLPWLAMAVAVTALLSVVYYLTHPFPAYGAGLYLEMAERIVANGYAPPETIPGWTADGVPFAYPPLLFYVVAVLIDLGVGPMTIAWGLPMLATAAYLVPLYYAARELLGTRRRAGLATVAYAATPYAIEWHLSAGGIVRAPAHFLVLTGLYCGAKLFVTGERPRRWVLPATVLFGLTALTHPMWAQFFAVNFLALYLAFDRSLAGIVRGAVVAGGGLLLAVPWWGRVLLVYGLDTITGASGTRTGLVGGPGFVWDTLVLPAFEADALSAWHLMVIAGVALAVLQAVALVANRLRARRSDGTARDRWDAAARDRWVRRARAVRLKLFLAGWTVVCVATLSWGRYWFVPGAMLLGVYLDGVLRPRPNWADRFERFGGSGESTRRSVAVVAVVALFAFMTVVTGAAAAGHPLADTTAMKSLVNEGDGEAMEWVQSETPEDATFVVLGRGAEWFPYFTDRTILVSPWGTEWEGESWTVHMQAHRQLSRCPDADCLSERLERYDVRPDYVYVQKRMAEYDKYGSAAGQEPEMHRSLEESDRYEVVFENEGATVVRVCERGGCGSDDHSGPGQAWVPTGRTAEASTATAGGGR